MKFRVSHNITAQVVDRCRSRKYHRARTLSAVAGVKAARPKNASSPAGCRMFRSRGVCYGVRRSGAVLCAASKMRRGQRESGGEWWRRPGAGGVSGACLGLIHTTPPPPLRQGCMCASKLTVLLQISSIVPVLTVRPAENRPQRIIFWSF